MSTTEPHPIVPAVRAFAALMDIAEYMEREGAWRRAGDIRDTIAASVRAIFDDLAWADRRLDVGECKLLDELIAVDNTYTGSLQRAFEEPRSSAFDWSLVEAAATFDRLQHTRLADSILEHLNVLGRSVIRADDDVTPEESAELRARMESLRARFVRA